MSAGKRFYNIARLLLWLTSGARQRILTIHSGSFLREFARLSPRRAGKAIRAIRAFDDVICVNEEQRRFLGDLISSRLHLIPAFLPCPQRPNPCIPDDAEAVLRDCDAVILTSGSGEPIYDFATVLRGVESAQRRTGLRLGLLVATYKCWDMEYWGGIEKALAESRLSIAVTRDLRPHEFSLLASRARVYVRGSLTDGDALAIREAAAAGAQIVATDAVRRPDGAALFPIGDSENLADLLLRALADRDLGRLADGSTNDNYAAIRAVYGLPQPVHRELAAVH
jgi:glycosyltransferase involved in cell wall biosynthesis